MTMIQQINAARRISAPIVAINTPDPASTIRIIQTVLANKPLTQWDVVNGVRSMNSLSARAVTQMHTVDGALMPSSMITSNPVEALKLSTQWLPDDSVLFFHNAHFYVEQGPSESHKPVVQAVWNSRDAWMANRRTLILLSPGITVPVELRNDVTIIDEALPTDKEMAPVVARGISRAMGRKVTRKQATKLISAVSGLASFNAEMVVAMSVSQKTKKVDMDQVWSQKIKIIEQTRGLRVYRGAGSFSMIGGNENIKRYMIKLAHGKNCPWLVIFLDEIEKIFQAAGMDTSGTTTDQMKVLLTEMQDNNWTGFLIYGFAGTGKSQLAKAFGNECGCLTVEADLPAMKNIWVGSSEANMRGFMKVVKAMGGRNVCFVATCNSVVSLPPELKRRFKHELWFCDLPERVEKDSIWDIYGKKFAIDMTQPKPNDEGWTGAEIERCNEKAHEFGISLVEAAQYMTITSQSMGDQVEKMRMVAHGKFLDAHHHGIYHYKRPEPQMKTLMQKLKGE